MATSKLKNRRRFITRDIRLDIPEDQELTISSLEGSTSQHHQRLSPHSTTNTSLIDRTWPRRTWRPANDFGNPIGLQQNLMVNATSTLPRFHPGPHEAQAILARSGHCSTGSLQPPPPSDWRGNGNSSPTSSADTRWRFRNLSDVMSSNCPSAVSSPSETTSEPWTICQDDVVYDAGSLSSRNSNFSSPRDLTTTSALGSISEISDDRTIFGLDVKPRSYSLNESSAYRPFFNRFRSNRSSQPGSVLHRALTWEMAGKSQPFRVTVSPISDRKGQEVGFRRNASSGTLHVVEPRPVGLYEPSSGLHSNSASKGVDLLDNSWMKMEEGLAVADCNRTIRSSPVSTGVSDFSGVDRTEQGPWNLVCNAMRSEQAHETICKNFGNSSDFGKLEQHASNGSNSPRANEFQAFARVSSVKTNQSSCDPIRSRNETQNSIFPNIFRDSRSNEMGTSKGFLFIPFGKKPLEGETAYGENNTYPSHDDFSAHRSFPTSRKPVRSKSLKLLNSEAMAFTIGKDSCFQRPLSDWKTDTISLSTPNSPHSPPKGEVETAPKQVVQHSLLVKPCMSMITLNTEPMEHKSDPGQWDNLRPRSVTRSATSLLGTTSLITDGPFTVANHRQTIEKPIESTSISERVKPANVKPISTNFVVRRITSLAKNPFQLISTVEESKNGSVKPAQSFATTQTINAQNSAFVKPTGAAQFEQKEQRGQSPALTQLEQENFYQDPVEVTFPYDSSNTYARDKKQVPWSGTSAWQKTSNTTHDEVYSTSSCVKFISSEDTSYRLLSPTVTSEKVTVLADTKLPLQRNEDRTPVLYGDSTQIATNSNQTNGKSCPRLIRVFLKSSSQLKDETCDSHVDQEAVNTATERRNLDIKWNNEASKAKLDDCPPSNWNDGARTETDDPVQGSVRPGTETSPKANLLEYFHKKPDSNKSSAPLENDGIWLLEQQKQNEEAPACDWDMNSFANTRPVATCSGVEEIKSSNTGLKKPFEIVKRKLIIPEPMSWFRSKDDNSKSCMRPAVSSLQEHDSQAKEDRYVSEFRGDTKQSDALKFASTVHKGTEISQKSVLRVDEVGRKSNQPTDGENISYIASISSTADLNTSSALPVHPKTSVLESAVSVTPSTLAITFDTGISLYPGNDDYANNGDRAVTSEDFGELGFKKSANAVHVGAVYSQPEDDLGFFNSWTDVLESENRCEPTAANLLSETEVPLGCPPVQANPLAEEMEAEEFQAIVECSIMTELDQAIEMLTAARSLENKAAPKEKETSTKIRAGQMTHENSLTPWEGISRKLTQAFSDQKNRQMPLRASPVQDKTKMTVSTALNYLEQKPVAAFSSFKSSCKPIAPVHAIRLSQNDVQVEGKTTAIDKRNQWMVLAREDSFNRPDSPLFRKTLPLPKDSVIMRHRMHQKELGCSGGGAGSLSSSSESSDDDSPVLRVAPRRTRRSRSISAGGGKVMTGVGVASEENEDRNEERDSIVSSTTSIRPLSRDSSFLSEDNR